MLENDISTLIQDIRRRKSVDLIIVAVNPLGIEEDLERIVVLFDQVLRTGSILLALDGQDHEWLIGVFSMDSLDMWKLHNTVPSGGKPEVEKHDLPPEIGKGDLLSVHAGHPEVRRRPGLAFSTVGDENRDAGRIAMFLGIYLREM